MSPYLPLALLLSLLFSPLAAAVDVSGGAAVEQSGGQSSGEQQAENEEEAEPDCD